MPGGNVGASYPVSAGVVAAGSVAAGVPAPNYAYNPGAYLPAQYRTYYVRDPYFYGLRPAPHGYRYVHAGSDILLVAVATGLIASVLSNVY